MIRVKLDDVNNLLGTVNTLMGVSGDAYSKDEHGRKRANVGTAKIDMCGPYKGSRNYRVVVIDNPGGGVHDLLGTGYITKRELYYALKGFVEALQFVFARNLSTNGFPKFENI